MKKLLALLLLLAGMTAQAATWTQPNYGGVGLTGTGAGQPYAPIVLSNQSGTLTANGTPIGGGSAFGSGTNFQVSSGTTGNVSILLQASGTGTDLINLSGTGRDTSSTVSFDGSGDTFFQHNLTVEQNVFYGNGNPLLQWNNISAWTLNDDNGNIVTDGTFIYSPLNQVKISGSNGLVFSSIQGGTNGNIFLWSGSNTFSAPITVSSTSTLYYQLLETGTLFEIYGNRGGFMYNYNTLGGTLILGGTGNSGGVGIGMTPVNTLDVSGTTRASGGFISGTGIVVNVPNISGSASLVIGTGTYAAGGVIATGTIAVTAVSTGWANVEPAANANAETQLGLGIKMYAYPINSGSVEWVEMSSAAATITVSGTWTIRTFAP